MPVVRQACDRCRSRKSRCVWPDERPVCARCRANGIECVAPPRDIDAESTTYPVAGGNTANHPTLPTDVYDRIQRLEQLFASLQNPALTSEVSSAVGTTADAHGDIGETPASSSDDFSSHSGLGSLGGDLVPAVPSAGLADYSTFMWAGDSTSSAEWASCSHITANPPIGHAAHRRDDEGELDIQRSGKPKRCYLPTADVGVALINEYLHDFNSKIPLFHPESLYSRVRDCYTGVADKKPLLWIHTYIAFAIAHRMRAMGLFATREDTAMAEWYLQRCLSTLPELLMGEGSLYLAQALLGVSILLETSNRWQRAGLFVSTAMRMVQDLGYHDLASVPGSVVTAEDRAKAYVFWLAFMMDTKASLSACRLSVQRRAEITTPLPSANAEDWWSLGSPQSQSRPTMSNVFSLNTNLAVIQAEVLEELFSVSARKRSGPLIQRSRDNLLYKLDVWRRSNAILCVDVEELARSVYRSDLVHCLVLEAAYFRTVYQLHATGALNSCTRPLSVPSPQVLEAMVELGFPGCADGAMRLLSLAALIPQKVVATTWLTLDVAVAALCAVLTHIQSTTLHASDVRAIDSDAVTRMQLCKGCLDGLQVATEHNKDSALRDSIAICRRLYEAARVDFWLSKNAEVSIRSVFPQTNLGFGEMDL